MDQCGNTGIGGEKTRAPRARGRSGTRARAALLSGTALVSTAVCLALAPPAAADTWTGATNSDWSVGSNWNTGLPPATGADVVLTNAGSAPTNHDQSPAYNSVTFNPNAAGYTINSIGANPIVLQSGGAITDNNTAAGSPGDGQVRRRVWLRHADLRRNCPGSVCLVIYRRSVWLKLGRTRV
jgi:hypothetical protein